MIKQVTPQRTSLAQKLYRDFLPFPLQIKTIKEGKTQGLKSLVEEKEEQ